MIDELIIKCCYDCENFCILYYLWIEWVLMWTIEWWSWCHTFGIMYELCLFEYIKYNIPMFNRYRQASLMI